MSEIRERLEVHRNDALVLLEAVSSTARLHEGLRLAGAVGHLARAQVLLAKELFGLGGASGPRPVSSQDYDEPSLEDTPIDGLGRVRPKGQTEGPGD
jgi:hypothetical protein